MAYFLDHPVLRCAIAPRRKTGKRGIRCACVAQINCITSYISTSWTWRVNFPKRSAPSDVRHLSAGPDFNCLFYFCPSSAPHIVSTRSKGIHHNVLLSFRGMLPLSWRRLQSSDAIERAAAVACQLVREQI